MVKKYFRLPLRTYFTFLFCVILFLSCLLSIVLVLGIYSVFYKDIPTKESLYVLSFCTCLLTFLFGALSMWFGAYHLTKPIVELNQVVKAVAQGDYSHTIVRKQSLRKDADYLNEIDELAESFNSMTGTLSRTDRIQKDFVSNVSHEFKTPLASLVSIAELLENGALSEEEEKTLLTLLKSESLRLSNLSTTLLDLSHLDYLDKMPLNEIVRIDEQIRHALILITEKWTEKEIDLTFDAPATSIRTNADWLMMIWINLIENAVKYSSDRVHLEICLRDKGDFVEVVISDDGIGMSKEEIEHIFDPFYQADDSRHISGNGLGLALVKRILTLMEADISYQSQKGQGTQVKLSLPKK